MQWWWSPSSYCSPQLSLVLSSLCSPEHQRLSLSASITQILRYLSLADFIHAKLPAVAIHAKALISIINNMHNPSVLKDRDQVTYRYPVINHIFYHMSWSSPGALPEAYRLRYPLLHVWAAQGKMITHLKVDFCLAKCIYVWLTGGRAEYTSSSSFL